MKKSDELKLAIAKKALDLAINELTDIKNGKDFVHDDVFEHVELGRQLLDVQPGTPAANRLLTRLNELENKCL